ncbi:hypothetical protein WKH57_01480 [Niallia taxi]|uniref:hypothetical protein n=1 Tax=Niallia taxi TaxID=2499688 RepID=UPI0031751B8B
MILTGYFVIALVESNIIYAMHSKVYVTESVANAALKKLRNSKLKGKRYQDYRVWGISDLTKLG